MARKGNLVGLVGGWVVLTAALAWGQGRANPAGPLTLPIQDFGVMPRPAYLSALLKLASVQDALEIPAASRARVLDAAREYDEQMQHLRVTPTAEAEYRSAREEISRQGTANLTKLLGPKQFERLLQLQLQAQGPLAFTRPGVGDATLDGRDLAQRLRMTEPEAKRLRSIAEAGIRQIEKVAVAPLPADPRAPRPDPAALRRLVGTAESQAARRKAEADGRRLWQATLNQVDQALTAPQRQQYHAILGAPFDLSKIRSPDEAADDVALLMGTRGRSTDREREQIAVRAPIAVRVTRGDEMDRGAEQAADLDYDTNVARPTNRVQHPHVLFDEAHHNFHTSDGLYQPFAQLMINDGYAIIPNPKPLSPEVLAGVSILLIANAMPPGTTPPGVPESAFTAAETDAVVAWVQAGGSLLLITDHGQFGAGAEDLAGRFGVAMSKRFTADPVNSIRNKRSLVFTQENHLLANHPIIRGRNDSERVNRVQTFSGQSLKGPAGSVSILKLADSAVDELAGQQPWSAANRAQGLAFTSGEGRVVVLGEAGELSAQIAANGPMGMNVPGVDNRQFALNIMHWLSGELEPRPASPAGAK